MRRMIWVAGALALAPVSLAAPVRHSARVTTKIVKPIASVAVKQENQFSTVEEFVAAKRAPKTPASVEGYIVLAYKMKDGAIRLALTDSVDHVLTARDAQIATASGALANVPASALRTHPNWAWTAKGLERFVMYTGAGKAQKPLHDTVAKARVTGLVAAKRTLGPVTKIEAQDENGEWKTL